MTDFVRVTDPVTKAHVTVTAARAKALGLTPLKEDAVDRRGRPLPATPKAAAEQPTPKTPAGKAEDSK